MLVVETVPINTCHKLRSQLSAFQVSLWVKLSNSTSLSLLLRHTIAENAQNIYSVAQNIYSVHVPPL